VSEAAIETPQYQLLNRAHSVFQPHSEVGRYETLQSLKKYVEEKQTPDFDERIKESGVRGQLIQRDLIVFIGLLT
jgi:hypothetical protein